MSRYVVRTYKVAVPKELYPLCAELNKTAARIYNKTMSLVKKIKYKKGFRLSPNNTQNTFCAGLAVSMFIPILNRP